MEVILIKDMENLGYANDIVNVKPGYANNYLIPQGYAKAATASAKKVLAENLRQRAHKDAKILADAQALAETIANLPLSLAVKAEEGKLFGTVTAADLAEALAAKGIELDRKVIVVDAIKTQIKHTRIKQRPKQRVLLHDVLRSPYEFTHGNHTRQRGVFHQCDNLVAHGRHNALDHLQKHHAEKDLPVCHAKHLPGFVLALGDAFNATAVYLGKVGGIVDDEGNQNSGQAALHRHAKRKAGHIEHNDNLQHQRCAADNPDKSARQPAQRSKAAHRAKANHKPQRKRSCQSDEENQAGGAKAVQQLQGNNRKRHGRYAPTAPHGAISCEKMCVKRFFPG